jgi:CRP-like cAMP-binding protein
MSDLLDLATITISAFFIVLAVVLLLRYREASKRVSESAELNHDLWRAMEDRLKKQDERILDLMGRVEVLQAHYVSGGPLPRVVMPRDMQPSQPATPFQLPREPRAATRLQPEADDTEKAAIRLLADGAKSTIEVKKAIDKSREHTARMMKSLFDKGLVTRDDSAKPFVYQLTERGRAYLDSSRM